MEKQANREGWLRRTARRHGLVASKLRDGLWRLSFATSVGPLLLSPEGGMTLDEAEEFLRAFVQGFEQAKRDLAENRISTESVEEIHARRYPS